MDVEITLLEMRMMLCFGKGRRDESLTFGSFECDIRSTWGNIERRSYEHVIAHSIRPTQEPEQTVES